MARLSIRGVSKTYPNGVTATRDVDLEIEDGAFAVIVGPSGCGKSTLLRMVAGLERLSAGEIHIGARRVDQLEPSERDIAMVFQNYALYPHMSVFDNMAYGLRNRREKRAVIREKVEAAAQMLGLSDFLGRKPRQLSGGQRQRVAMGRAMVRQPKIFLFDEPLSNLDAKLRAQMRVEIKRLQRELGVTSLFVTHDQTEAMTLADTLIAMNDGRVEQVGPPLTLYERPESRFVAEFIGAPAMMVFAADGALARWLTEPPAAAATLGVRPEAVRIVANAVEPSVPATVELVEPLGAEALVYLRAGGERLIARVSMADAPSEAADVGIMVAPGALAAFDADGRRLDIAVEPRRKLAQ